MLSNRSAEHFHPIEPSLSFEAYNRRGRCKYRGKAKFNKHEADSMTKDMMRAINSYLSSYKCPHCKMYHITSQPN